MSVKTFLAVISILAVAYGVAFILAPGTLGAIYGTANSPASEMMSRFFGVALLPLGLILWFARDFDGPALRNVLVAIAIGDTAGIGVSALGTLAGVMNVMGWTAVLIYVFGAVGAFWFLKGN
ncbi:hypothetical protein K9U39_18395 [Rhodoblastus acidophilus]|uniref:DUF4345 domain-containing protein n=1 Tax=Candidatus Rhodoblastus alkanivorans TaxID=2954117 RepID=A0ABS9Z2E8_9HYPH|nr:hypothetical protein [Candidatus Rhodoblastus alkanivorans]MCI4677470.1 hypothetical protein [Candidatus Rhodoblastus alkanivorans]MCI4681829.1 hypothetical protein [Candidatus Rhodoblastus alkanivorans]MDI4642879.1 hypothetical protein [Rhodoblastus acidophilus]